MTSRLTVAIRATVFSALCLCSSTHAQHFAKPPAIDRASTPAVAVPAFTISRSTTSFGSVVADGWLYVMGGYTGRPHDYDSEGQSTDFYRINLLNPSHTEALPNTDGLQSNPLETWRGKIIMTGGMKAHNARGEDQILESLKTVKAFDVKDRTWSRLPDLPLGRSSHDTAVVGDRLYVIGGWSMDPDTSKRTWAEIVLMLDLTAPDLGWTEVAELSPRRALATVAADHHIVVIGGLTNEREITNSVAVLDTQTHEWSSAPDFPGAAFGVAADEHNGSVYASGSDGNVYAWAPGDDAWKTVATLIFPRFFHQVAIDDSGHLHVLGGTSRGIRPVHVERLALEPSNDTPTPGAVIAHWRVPSPAAAKNRQGMFIEDGWLYAFGGNNSTGQHDFQQDNFLSEGFRLSLAGLTWRTMPSLPLARQTIQTAHAPDEKSVVAIGGFGHDGEVARTFAQGFEYSLRDRDWRSLGQVLPVPRSQFGLVQHGGSYWVFGGLDYDSRREQGDHFRHLTPILKADAAAETLSFQEIGVDLMQPRRAFAGALMQDKYYIVSGMRENFQIVEQSEIFDFTTQMLSAMPSPSRPRLSATLVALDGKLYLAGGSSPRAEGGGLEPNKSIEVFDPQTQRWSTLLSEIPISPRHMRMMPFRGRLLLVSSHVDETSMTHVALIEPDIEQATTPTTTAQAEAP